MLTVDAIRSSLSVIRSAYALLLWFWQVLSLLQRAVTPVASPLDRDIGSSLLSLTRGAYRGELQRFVHWLGLKRRRSAFDHELDVELLEYRREVRLCRAEVAHLTAAVRKLRPLTRRNLVVYQDWIYDSMRQSPPRHTLP